MADQAGRGWPSPRSWESVARLLATCDAAKASEEARTLLVLGAVGEGAGIEFLSWLANMDLPDPEDVLADPDGFELPERSDRAFAVLDRSGRGGHRARRRRSRGLRPGGSSPGWPTRRPTWPPWLRGRSPAHGPTGAELPSGLLQHRAGAACCRPDAWGRGRVILGPLERLGTDQRRAWAAARVWAAHQVPYMASALLALEPVVVDQSDEPPGRASISARLPVDRQWHVYLDPEVLAGMDGPDDRLLARPPGQPPPSSSCRARYPVGIHTAASRAVSSQSPEQQRWNLAADAEINDDLVAGNPAGPEAAVTPRSLGLARSLTAEQYWDALGGAEPAVRTHDTGQRKCRIRHGADGRAGLRERL